MSLTRPEVMRAPDSLRPAPVQEPSPPRLIRFPVGPAVLWVPSAEHAQWVRGEAFQISAPSIKMMLYRR
jgi:hypothetical protein